MDTDPRLVGIEILTTEKAHVIGGHHRHLMPGGQLHRQVQIVFLLGTAGTLQLKIETVGEQPLPVLQPGLGLLAMTGQQRRADLPLAATREGDQPLRLALKPVALEHRVTTVLALQIATGDESGEVFVTGVVTAQQHHTVGTAGIVRVLDPDIDTDDGLDALGHTGAVELHHAEQVDLVGNGHRRHAGPGHCLGQGFDTHDTVHQGVFAVQM